MSLQYDASGNLIDGVQIIGSKFQDLGLAVEGLTMAAGATVYGSWLTNMYWVRNIIIFGQSDQQYDGGFFKQDTAGTQETSGVSLFTNQGAVTSPNWRSQLSVNGVNALLGYGARFFIKNSSASANTYARLRIQLLGM